jgi:glycosyltransferase involved in cell wall biosynthesis
VRFLGAVYDGVDDLYAGCRIYLHGHEVGGLNPGLLRAMGARACCFALGTPFNEEAIGEAGRFWTKEGSVLASLIRGVDEGRVDAAALGESAKVRAASHYSWDDVAARHDSWFRILARGASAGSE